MVLTLYHDDREPHKVYNIIKVTVDNFRTLKVHVKHGVNIEHLQFQHEEGYHRFTVQLD